MMPGIGDTPLVGTDTGSYAGGSLDTQTVFVGALGSAANENRERGFIYAAIGGCTDGTSNLYGGAQVKSLYATEDTFAVFDVIFSVAGVVSNSGWNTINIGGSFTLSRASATFSTSGGNSSWTWYSAGNAFGGAGSTKVVGFD